MMLYISFGVDSFKVVYMLLLQNLQRHNSVSKCLAWGFFLANFSKKQDGFRVLIFTYVQIFSITWFLCPRNRRSGGILICKSFLTNSFWTVSDRALIFHMSISCDKTFPCVPLCFNLWPWPWSLTHFLKTLTLLITFEQWVLELWFPCVTTFLWVPLFLFTLWPWPWSLTHFLKL